MVFSTMMCKKVGDSVNQRSDCMFCAVLSQSTLWVKAIWLRFTSVRTKGILFINSLPISYSWLLLIKLSADKWFEIRVFFLGFSIILTLSQTTNFTLFQTERQFQIWWQWKNVLQTGRKHCGKRRNCSLWAISSFPTVFSKDLNCRHVKIRACLGKG